MLNFMNKNKILVWGFMQYKKLHQYMVIFRKTSKENLNKRALWIAHLKIGQKVTVEPLSTPEAQIENKG